MLLCSSVRDLALWLHVPTRGGSGFAVIDQFYGGIAGNNSQKNLYRDSKGVLLPVIWAYPFRSCFHCIARAVRLA